MMIPLIEKADFTKSRRDRLLDYDDYVAKAENLIKRIPNAANKLTDKDWLQDADAGMLLSLTAARSEYALDLLSISYSAGVQIDALRSAFPEVVNYFDEYALYSEKYNETPEGRKNPGPHIAIRDVEFTRANRLVCFAILLGWTKLLSRIMAIIKYNNDELDGMLERLAALYIPTSEVLPADCTRHLPYYKTLAIFHADPGDRAELMRNYLEDWYEASRREPYYESHENARRYLGYWSWEAGAISFALNIDEHLYLDHEFYPRELVAFGKAIAEHHSGQSAGISRPELRAKAGGNCPMEGTWESIGIPSQRTKYASGEKLRDLESPYGLTVWRYVHD